MLVSKNTVGEEEYNNVYKRVNDTTGFWCENKLESMQGEIMWRYYIDSLLCFNRTKDRFITNILVPCQDKLCTQDEIKLLCGEKINGVWYFFSGNSTLAIPRENYQNDVHKPLSYIQLHQIALKEVYGGYLNDKGEINEAWFTNHFESIGWCSTCKTRDEFEKVHLKAVRDKWKYKTTSAPL